MSFSNWMQICRMLLNPKNLKFLLKVYHLYKNDDNFSYANAFKSIRNMIQGENIVKFGEQYLISSFLPPIPSRASISHLTAVKEEGNLYTQQMLSQRSAPISIYLAITKECPFNCIHCSARGREETQELTTREWIKTIKELQDMGTSIIGITGGEPMVRKDLPEIIEAIDERSISYLYTTGVGLSLEKAKFLKGKGLFGVGISLDSYIEAEHNQVRGNAKAYQIALQAIKNASQAGLYTMVQKVVFKQDVDEGKLMELFKLTKTNGAHEVRLLEPIKSGELFDTDEEIFYTSENRQKLIDIQLRVNKQRNLPKVTTFAYTESKEKYGCGAGTQHSYISYSGDLYPCDFVPLSFGNVKETRIRDLWGEMNLAIGIPKSECFAMQINQVLIQKSVGKLPLDKEMSLEICQNYQCQEYPQFYKLMQGNKK